VKFWFLILTWYQVLRLAMLETILRKKKNNNNNCKLQHRLNHRLQCMVDYQLGDCLKEGTQIFILLLAQRKVWQKVSLHTSTKTAHHCLCWCCFSQKFFICKWNRPMYTTNNTVDRQAWCSRWLPDITLLDMMTFVALALQMATLIARHTTCLLVKT